VSRASKKDIWMFGAIENFKGRNESFISPHLEFTANLDLFDLRKTGKIADMS
jgi:hypothetical protein